MKGTEMITFPKLIAVLVAGFLVAGLTPAQESGGFGGAVVYHPPAHAMASQNDAFTAANKAGVKNNASLKGLIVTALVDKKNYGEILTNIFLYRGNLPPPAVIGCSGDWRRCFVNGRYVDTQYIALLALGGTGITVQAGCVEKPEETPEAKARQLGEMLKSADAKLVIVYGTSGLIKQPGAAGAFLQGLQQTVGKDVAVLGTVVADDAAVFFNKQSYTNAVVALALGGRIKVAMESYHPFEPVARHKATKTSGKKLLELDGKAVAEVYGKDTGGLPRGLRNAVLTRRHPFAVEKEGRTRILYQGLLQDDGSYQFEQEIAEGGELLVMEAAAGRLVKAAGQAAGEVRKRIGDACLLLVCSNAQTWDSHSTQSGVLASISRETGGAGCLLGWFCERSMTSIDGVTDLTGYVVGIAGTD